MGYGRDLIYSCRLDVWREKYSGAMQSAENDWELPWKELLLGDGGWNQDCFGTVVEEGAGGDIV